MLGLGAVVLAVLAYTCSYQPKTVERTPTKIERTYEKNTSLRIAKETVSPRADTSPKGRHAQYSSYKDYERQSEDAVKNALKAVTGVTTQCLQIRGYRDLIQRLDRKNGESYDLNREEIDDILETYTGRVELELEDSDVNEVECRGRELSIFLHEKKKNADIMAFYGLDDDSKYLALINKIAETSPRKAKVTLNLRFSDREHHADDIYALQVRLLEETLDEFEAVANDLGQNVRDLFRAKLIGNKIETRTLAERTELDESIRSDARRLNERIQEMLQKM